jgi:hypothetical protein
MSQPPPVQPVKFMPMAYPVAPQPDGPLSALIPYRNPSALAGYYLGIFSFIPALGILLGITALILGILGLKKAGANPQVRGKAHAWTAILCGGILGIGQLVLLFWLLLPRR